MPEPATTPLSIMMTRLSKWFTRPFSWVTTTTVVPSALMRSKRCASARICFGPRQSVIRPL